MTRRIDVEAHFFNRSFVEVLRAREEPPREEVEGDLIRVWTDPLSPDVFQQRHPRLDDALLDLGQQRIAAMDAVGIDVQVLSLGIPHPDQFEPPEGAVLARESNDALAAAIAEHPDRFVGLASVAPSVEEPEEAANELERSVRQLGFRGLQLHTHVGDTYLDDPRYEPIFERAAHLGVPVYVHPMIPAATMIDPYRGRGRALVGPGLGFGHEAAVQVMRLVYGGLFDRLPDLQIVLGHLGEGLYFWLYRLDFDFRKKWVPPSARPDLERWPSEYLKTNVHVSLSGNFLTSAFLATMDEIGPGRIMFASDHPFEDMGEAVNFLEQVDISDTDRKRIFSKNAAALFNI